MDREWTRCTDAIRHSVPNVHGRCNFCGKKIAPAAPMPRIIETTNLAAAYRTHYDPDYEGDDEWIS